MKKILFTLGFSFLAISNMMAQEATLDGVPILEDAYMTKMTRNGNIFTGFTTDESAIFFNQVTHDAYYYFSCSAGKGYPAADNGWMVGCDMEQQGIAIIMADGDITLVEPLVDNYIMSNLHSITPDGTRVCGVAGQGMSIDEDNYLYRPIICDIDEDGNISEPVILPFPDKDFFEKKPQYCSAVWMSSDGKTIVGQVIENTGMLNTYPIVYREDENGNWSYSLPSEHLFNPDNIPMPEDPGEFRLDAPQYEDFMTDEEKEEFQEAVDNWLADGSPEENNPYENLDLYMTLEEIEAFNEAAEYYNEKAMEYNESLWDYQNALYKIADSSVLFLRNAMTLSADGKKMAMTAVYVHDPGDGDIYETYVPWIFDLEKETCYKTESDGLNLIANHILADGTLVASNAPSDVNPAKGYVCLEGDTEFIPIQDYLERLNPYASNWMNENLTGDVLVGINSDGEYMTREMTVTGCLAVSDDWSVIAAGVDGYTLDKNMYFTYYFTDILAGVEKNLSTEDSDSGYKVWNLQGQNILNTKNKEEVRNLPHGIYIVNGRKVAI